jgi:hypothetical protein
VPSLHKKQRRKFAVDVVRRLRRAGYEAYWAGGCVRDLLLGLEPKDYDVATSATPEQVQEVFRNRKTVLVGASFGVVVVVGPRGAGQVDVATFRSEGAYLDGRRPSSVHFTTAKEDVQRRDFTINGLLYDPLAEQAIDFVGGLQDLQRRVIRAIGDPRQRFDEDKLRMLRAVRFAARFEFQLDADTRAAITTMAPQIRVVSAERIAQEMRWMLVDRHRRRAMQMCCEVGLLTVVAPQLAPYARSDDLRWQHTLAVLDQLAPPRDVVGDAPADEADVALPVTLPERHFPLALAALLLELNGVHGSPREAAGAVLELGAAWRLSNHESQRAAWLVEHRHALRDAPHAPWSRVQPVLVHPGIAELLALLEAECRAGGRPPRDVNYCRQKLALPPEKLDPPPLLTGEDLIRAGVPRGKVYRVLLEVARRAQLDGEITTRDEALHLVQRLLAQRGDEPQHD